jgi:twitching motility protein PilI
MSEPNAAFRKLLDYEERALSFEPGKGKGIQRTGEWAGVIFSIGESRLTCNIDRVHEFLPPPPVTRVPGTKPWILGLANVRGDLVTIVDLSCYLGGERTNITVRSRLLAASLRGRPVGLLVDEVFGQRSFASDEAGKAKIEKKSPLHGYITKQFTSDKEIWQVLDLDTLFGTPEFLNGAAA